MKKSEMQLGEKRGLTSQEQIAIGHLKQKRKSPPTIFRAVESENEETFEFALDGNLVGSEANDLLDSQIMKVTGTADRSVAIQLLSNLGKALIPSKVKGKELVSQLNIVAHSMHALAPQDEYESQLVAQLVVLHEHSMDWLGRAMRTERVDFANVYLNGASKLLTRHHETLEALLKYRRKGEQRVHVEHVHVHGGGQAIVGNVSTGGGMKPLIKEGPHAKV